MTKDRVHRPQGSYANAARVIDGLPAYYRGQAPDSLATQNQLISRGLRRGAGQLPSAWLWYRDGGPGYRGGPRTWDVTALYDLAGTRPKRPTSARQLEVLARGRNLRQICGTCADDTGRNLGSGRECGDCREARLGGRLAERLTDLGVPGAAPGDEQALPPD